MNNIKVHGALFVEDCEIQIRNSDDCRGYSNETKCEIFDNDAQAIYDFIYKTLPSRTVVSLKRIFNEQYE